MPQGRKGHIGLGKETTFGTPVAAADYFRFRSENVVTQIEEVTPPNIQGVFDEGPTYQGLETHQGEIVFDGHPNILGWFLLGGLGPVTTTEPDIGVRWRHVFVARQTEFSELCVPQPLTLEIHRDLGQAFQLAGSAVATLALRFGIGEKVLAATAGIIAKSMARITATTPTFEATTPFFWHQAQIRLPQPTAFVTKQDVAIEINQGVEGKAYIDGTRTIARIRASGSRVITVSGTALANDTEFTAFRNRTLREMQIEFTGPVLGGGTYRLLIEIPVFQLTAYPVGVAGPDEIMVEYQAKAKWDAGAAGSPLRVTLDNSKSAY